MSQERTIPFAEPVTNGNADHGKTQLVPERPPDPGSGPHAQAAHVTPEPTLERVHPSRLLSPLQDLRHRDNAAYKEFFDRLCADVKERAVQVPLIGYREDAQACESIRLIDGETRRLAALLSGQDSVPVLVYDRQPPDAAVKLAQLQANAMRQDMTDVEYAGVYLDLMQQNGWTQAELSRRLHANASLVNKRLKVVARFPADLLALVGEGEGKIPFTVAHLLCGLPDETQIRGLADKVVKGLMTRERLVDDYLRKPKGGKGAKKPRPLRLKDGAVELLAQDPSLTAIQAFHDRLGAALKKAAKDGSGIEDLEYLFKTA